MAGKVDEYDPSEQDIIIDVFCAMLRDATKDGGNKRASGAKPRFDVDPEHKAAIFSHLNKWMHEEYRDAESGAHPLVHLAWRALAIAYQERELTAATTKQELEAAKIKRLRIERGVFGDIEFGEFHDGK